MHDVLGPSIFLLGIVSTMNSILPESSQLNFWQCLLDILFDKKKNIWSISFLAYPLKTSVSEFHRMFAAVQVDWFIVWVFASIHNIIFRVASYLIHRTGRATVTLMGRWIVTVVVGILPPLKLKLPIM